MPSPGSLYVVATPIGNMRDITLRAIGILGQVGLIISEDTRTTAGLLSKYGILAPMESYYSPKEKSLAEKYIKRLLEGTDIALLSENGTPCVSDPGFILISRAYEEGIKVVPIPGPSALTSALAICGFPIDEVFFAGFLPRKKGARKKYIENHINSGYAFVFYESKYRINDSLKYIADFAPDLPIALMREMTKKFEEVIRGPAREVCEIVNSRPGIKGEFTIVCSPSDK